MQNEEVTNKSPFFSKKAWKFYISLFEGQMSKLVWSSFGAALQALLIVPVVLLIRYAFDRILPEKNINLLILAGIAILVLRLCNSLLAIWLRGIHLKIINKSIFRLRHELLSKLYSLSRSFHTNHDPKILHTQLVVDTERLSNLSNVLVSRIFPAAIISFALLMVLTFLSWKLMIIVLGLAPLLVIVTRFTGKIVKKRVYLFQRAFESFSKGTFFILKYMDLTVIQSHEKKEMEKQALLLEDLQGKTNKMSLIYSISSNIQDLLTGFIGIVIIIAGGLSVVTGKMTLGDFISFYIAAGYLNRFANSITSSIPDIIAGNESLSTLYKLAKYEDPLPYSGNKKVDFENSIILESVSFKYTEQAVLENINLEVLCHNTYAISGPNSSGKTTLINLILGFYKPDKGQLLVDGIPFKEVDMVHLRKSFGVVMQHPPFFSGSIRENILYGMEDISEEDLIQSSKAALADNFIKNLPDAYETEIGEDGVLLSGGELQRIAIARALVRKPRMLILDEPTNHLDEQVIKEIMFNLENLENRPTVILISHDLNVVKYAFCIYRFENRDIKLIINH